MGDPKKPKKKYETPNHPWRKANLEHEAELLKKYGLRNKKEYQKMSSLLKKVHNQTKRLTSLAGTPQAEHEKEQLMQRLRTLGMISEEQTFEDILSLEEEVVLDRRLQSVVLRKNLARSPKQARQFIVHGHITVNGVKTNSPSFLVPLAFDSTVSFSPNSSIFSEEHPERITEQELKERAAKEKAKEDEKKKEEEPPEVFEPVDEEGKEGTVEEKKEIEEKKTEEKKEKKEMKAEEKVEKEGT